MKPLPQTNPEKAGLDSELLEKAIQFAVDNESSMNRDIGAALEQGHFEEPWPIGKTIGPVKNRKAGSGVILRHGEVVQTWGDVEYTDMTFSISKSYLALCMGIAVKDGLIPDVHQPIRTTIENGGFDTDQNQTITWAHMLQLTSEWEGTLWDKPDWIDRYRDVIGNSPTASLKGTKRPLQQPGTYWEYNDVRVNQLSYALMRAFGRPLPEVLKERVMDPIGASNTWEWHVDEVFVKINGERHYLWRAVDHEGEVLESYVTKKRDKKAALKFMKKAMRRHGSPNEIVTDKLGSYGAAARELGCSKKQVTKRWANNRVENSHLPFRRRERAILRFRRMHSLQKFASIHASFHNLFNSHRSLSKCSTFKLNRDAALTEWRSLVIS